MNDYALKQKYAVRDLRFQLAKCQFRGNGFVTWSPARGFHLDAQVHRHSPLPSNIEIGRPRVLDEAELSQIFMRLEDGVHLVTPLLNLRDHFALFMSNRLDIGFHAARFTRRYDFNLSGEDWVGSARLDIKRKMFLPDSIEQNTIIGERLVGQSMSRAALVWKDDSIDLLARTESDHYLDLQWSLCSKTWTKPNARLFPEVVQYALSLLSGTTVRLLERSMNRGNCQFVERCKRLSVKSLDSLAPLQPSMPLDKQLLIHLIKHMLRNPNHDQLFRRMIDQLSEASRQETHQAKELLCSTILEATLRTCDGCPFKPKQTGWKIRPSLFRFCGQFFSDTWKPFCENALRAWSSLRDRNAHPDWLIQHAGSQSKKKLEESIDHILYLSRFYGFMILAMAGVNDLKPVFPRLRDFGPAMTFAPASPDSDAQSDRTATIPQLD